MYKIIFCALFVVAVVASPLLDSKTEKKMVKIPDGFGGSKIVDLEAETEVNPTYVPASDVRFLLFTRQNRLVPQILTWNDMSTVSASNFMANVKTIFIAHGWQSDHNTEVGPLTTAAYLDHSDVNVIVIDWSIGAGNINYITSRNNVGPTGAHVAAFANNLNAAGLIVFSEITCCGQSLGAHVCGFLGKNTNGLIEAIFGLDPAGPLFSLADPANRLAAGDALYTESVHTDTVLLGIGDPICDVDYYPNYGTGQPGCTTSTCDHAIAPRFHVDTLRFLGLMWGRYCASIEQMLTNTCSAIGGGPMGGYPANGRQFGLAGIFILFTNENHPMGRGPF